MKIALLRLLAASFVLPLAALAQITISGVTDKSTYNDSVTLTVVTQTGYDYNATLNWKPIATGVPVVVNKPDFYELRVDATNQTTSVVATQYLRFIVNASERAGSEMGLPPHVPFPVIQSSSNEFVGAHLRVLVPSAWPGGLPLPVVAWVMDDQEHPVRANGILQRNGAPYGGGFVPFFQIKRGVGSGFVPTVADASALVLQLSLSGLATNPPIIKESNVVWTTVSGVLSATTSWPSNSRIHVTGGIMIPNGGTLTIGEGSIVLLSSRVDITNNGTVTVNGTTQNPVVFMPATNGQPWGGFVMKTSGAGIVNANATIFTGSGAEPNWFGANGNPGSHRDEQALFFCQAGQQLNLTDSAAIYLAGQLGHAVGAATTTFNATRFLMQRVTTGGEWTGASFTANDSAFIECPDDSVNFVDGDNDALYLVNGTHNFTNTLFGWTKDDGIDSGGDGVGRLHYEQCWFESIFHEGNSLSGLKNTTAHGTVYLDCGQGIEDGYGAGTGGPTGRVDTCFFSYCQSGVRHGDNYPSIGNGYPGIVIATNCVLLHNHRDFFGFNWRSTGWTNASGQFFANNNLITAANPYFPNNAVWNPASDGWQLATWGGVGRVGVGFAARSTSLANFAEGVSVGLSLFCTNEVTVNYEIDGTDGTHATGTLVFPAGLTRRFISAPTNVNGVLRIALLNPVNADVTGTDALLFQNIPPSTNALATVLSPFGATWRYLDDGTDQGTAWRALNFPDGIWSNGASRLGFGPDPSPLGATLRKFVQVNGVDTARQVTNYYFRRAIVVTNPADYATIQFRYQKDDGCIVYLNGSQIFTNNMPLPPITANTFASSTVSGVPALMTFWTNTLSPTNLVAGTNVIAVEVHQSTATSSDIAWHMELVGLPAPSAPRVNLSRLGADAVLYWNDTTFGLEEADVVTGPWRPASQTNSPSASPVTGTRFFRLKK